jgi:predicted dithiol-disulfide oxidoreductase (DUF899 family)
MSAYTLKDGTVYLTHSTTARVLEFMMGYHGFLDRAPLGRSEGGLAPRRHDQHHDANATSQQAEPR